MSFERSGIKSQRSEKKTKFKIQNYKLKIKKLKNWEEFESGRMEIGVKI